MRFFLVPRTILASLSLVVLGACHGGGGGGDSPPPTPPTAVAGNAQTVNKNATVTLDGSGSTDAQGRTLAYAWTQTAGAPVTLSSATSAKPTFTAPRAAGALTFSLVVNNGQTASQPATVTVTIADRAPVASAPATATVNTGSVFQLDGSASSDPDQDPLTFTWTQTGGSAVTLVPGAGGKATFTTPGTPETLVFSLTVGDGEMSSAPVTATITVVQANVAVAPVVSAGADFTSPKRYPIFLQGTVLSSGGRPLSYQWTQTAGTTVALQNPKTPFPSFVTPAAATDLTFSFTATEGGLTSLPSAITIHVRNQAPAVSGVALPTAPRRNDQISVNAQISDADNDAFTTTYVWKRNGTVDVTATTSVYPLGKQVKNDVISVTVTASDGELSTSVDATTTIADTPGVLSATPPTSATYGVPVTFDVIATDPDGDAPGPFEVDYGPAGFNVNAGGHVTWTPGGPMLDRSVVDHWGVRLKNDPAATLSGTITVNDPARKLPLVRTNAGIPVSNNSIDIQDFDGTGTQQVLVGTYHSVYLLAWHAGDYQQTWAYPFDTSPGSTIAAVASGDVDGDGHREIFFAAGPVVVKLDGVTRREVGRYMVPTPNGVNLDGPYCAGIRYADIDNDGKGELVCLAQDTHAYGSNGALYVLDAETMQPKWQTASLILGSSVAVGRVAPGTSLQIVTNGGYVFDGATHQNTWLYGPGFGAVVDIGNVSGDGLGKIVGLVGGVPRVFDAVLKSPVWEVPYSGAYALKVTNLDGASPDEIIVGDGQWGNVYVYRYDTNTHTAAEIARIPVQGDGVSAIGAGDVDANGQKELVFGSDYYSSGRDYLTVASWTPAPATLWSGPLPSQLDGPFYGARMARIAANTRRLMFVTPGTDSGYEGMRVIGLDPATGDMTVSSEVASNWSRNSAFDVGDVLGTGLDQMLIGTADLYTNYFTVYDHALNQKKWSSTTTSGGGQAIVHADLNGDGIDDFVGATANGYIYVYDVAHQALIWSSTGLGGATDVAVTDLDGDGVAEIVVTSANGVIVYRKSGSTYLQVANYPVYGSQLLVADADGNGQPEVYVLTGFSSGTMILRLDRNLSPLQSFVVPNAVSIHLEKSSYGRKNLVVGIQGNCCTAGSTSLFEVVDPVSGALVWQSPDLPGWVPKHSLEFLDVSGDAQLEMVFGTSTGMYVTQ